MLSAAIIVTPLHLARKNGHSETPRILLDRGADLEDATHRKPPLDWACKKGHFEIVRFLLYGTKITTAEATCTDDDDAINNGLLGEEFTKTTRRSEGRAPRQVTGSEDELTATRASLEADLVEAMKTCLVAEIAAKVRLEARLNVALETGGHLAAEVAGMKTCLEAVKISKARLEADLAATKDRHGAELAASQAEFATTKARLETELTRWRTGDIVCKQVIDVETGTVTTTAVEANSVEHRGVTEPRTKRPRQDDRGSLLSQLVHVKTEAVQATTRLQDELENTTLCTLCLDNPRDMYFVGCGHCLSCGACADRLVVQHGGTRQRTNAPCPVCRQPIKRLLPFKLV